MSRAAFIALAACLTAVWMQEQAFAQRGFSRRQQASLYAYQTQLQAQQQAQFQQQFQVLNQQLLTQQRAIQLQQFQDTAMLEYLNAMAGTSGGTVVPPRVYSGNRAASAFGTVHYYSPYYNRLEPYYNYGFIRSRNRQLSPAAATTFGY